MNNFKFFLLPGKKKLLLSIYLMITLNICSVLAAFDISHILISKIKEKYGADASQRVEQWQKLLLSAKRLPEQEKLEQVNNFFNQKVDFVDDIILWKLKDYWATPLEFLSMGAGDCEDFSIAKYFTLLELGVSEKKMRITYVKALELNQAHMVLTYFASPRTVPLVLDNLNPQIKPASTRKDLLPVYSFNGSGLWKAKSKGMGKRVGASSKLNMWAELKQRMLKNNF